MSDEIPTDGEHRGVPLHAGQSAARLEVVKRHIEIVLGLTDARELLRIAGDSGIAPEARLLAAAKLEAGHAIATDERRIRPVVSLEQVRATVAGLNSRKWRDPHYFCSLLDPRRSSQPVPRERPLHDD